MTEAPTQPSYHEHIRQLAANAPRLSLEQQSRLAVLLRPSAPTPGTAAFLAEEQAMRRRLEQAEAARLVAEEEARRQAEEARKAAARRCALYRHFDSEGQLLYVGISGDSNRRRSEHRKTAPWLRFQETETVQWLPDRKTAETAEVNAIHNEQPIFNLAGAVDGSRERRLKYLAEKGAWDMLSENR